MKKKAKLIIISIVAALVLCIGVSILVMALVPVTRNDRINKPNEVYIYSSSTKDFPLGRLRLRDWGKTEVEDVPKINKIFTTFNNGFKQNCLSALFGGELGKGLDTDYYPMSKDMNKNNGSSDAITIVFYYNETKLLIEGKNETAYKYLFFEIKNVEGRQEVKIGTSMEIPSDGETSTSTISYYYGVTAKLNNQNEVYACATQYVNEVL